MELFHLFKKVLSNLTVSGDKKNIKNLYSYRMVTIFFIHLTYSINLSELSTRNEKKTQSNFEKKTSKLLCFCFVKIFENRPKTSFFDLFFKYFACSAEKF